MGCISSLSSCVAGLLEPRFQHAYVKVRDAQGHFKRDRDHNPAPGEVHRDLVLHYLEDIQTGEFYLYEEHNDAGDIWLKCILLSVFTAPYAVATMTVGLAFTLVGVMTVALDVLVKFGQELESKGFCESASNLLSGIVTGFGKEIWPSLRMTILTPLCFVGVEIGALVGLVFPFDGRKLIVRVQTLWFNGATYRNDPRYHFDRHRNAEQPEPENMGRMVFFVAWCFLPRGSRNEDLMRRGEPVLGADGLQLKKFEVQAERTRPVAYCCC